MVCMVLIPCFCFAVSVCFGSFKVLFCLASPEGGVTFLQEDYSTHQFHRVFCFLRLTFAFIPLFVDVVRGRSARSFPEQRLVIEPTS